MCEHATRWRPDGNATALSQTHCVHLTSAGATTSRWACLCLDTAHWLHGSPLHTPNMERVCSVGEGRTACSIARRRGRMASKDGRTAGAVALQGSRTRSIDQTKRESKRFVGRACSSPLLASQPSRGVPLRNHHDGKFSTQVAPVLLRRYLPSGRFDDESL